MKKIASLLILLSFLAATAYAANVTPTGNTGDVQYNKGNGQFGPYSLGPGLVVTTSGNQSILSSTSTGGVAPSGPDGSLQTNDGGSFGNLTIGAGLAAIGGALTATVTNFTPAGPNGAIQFNNGGVPGAYTIGGGLSVVGGALTSTATGGGSTPGGFSPQLQYNNGTAFAGLNKDTQAAYAAHNTVMNGLAYDPRDPAYGAICGGTNHFAADGTTRTFNYTIPMTGSTSTDNSNFMVFYELTAGFSNATILNTSQFSVTGVNSGHGGTITLNSAPPNLNTIFVYHDDSAGLVAASADSVASGGYVSVPSGCTIYGSQALGTVLADGAQLIGQNFTPTYQFQDQSINPIISVIAPTGFEPAAGINISSKVKQFFEGFQITSNVIFSGSSSLGFNTVPVLIGVVGAHSAGSGGGLNQIPGIVAQYVTFNYGGVGFGAPIGGTAFYITAALRFNNFTANIAGIYGPLADQQIIGNNFNSNGEFVGFGSATGAGMVLGPQQSAAGNGGACRIEANRFEFNREGIIVNGGSLCTLDANEFDSNYGCGLDLFANWDHINLTGGWFRGNGFGNNSGTGSTTAGHDAHVCINGAGNSLHIANTNFLDGYARGFTAPIGSANANTPLYFLDVNTPAAGVDNISIEGDIQGVTGNNGSYVKDFAIYRQGQPTNMKINAFGQAAQGNLVNGQFAAQARGLPPSYFPSYDVFGDIVANGAQLPASQSYPTIIGTALGTAPTRFNDTSNFGSYDCDVVNTFIFPNYNPSTVGNPLVTWLPAVNDPNYNAPTGSPLHEADANSCRLAGLTWMSVPSSYKVYAQAGTQTGTWANFASYGGTIGLTSTTSGDTLAWTTTTNGGPLYLWYELQGGSTATFQVSLDSALVATVSAAGNNVFTFPVHPIGYINSTSITGGSSYTNGGYTNVPLTGGSGTGALAATITVSGGAVTALSLSSTGHGINYAVGDMLSATTSSLGGTGSGFALTVNSVGSQAPAALRIPVLSKAGHAVSVLSQATTGNPVTILGLGTPPGKPYLGGNPTVFLGGQLYQYNNANAGLTAAYNLDELTQANQLLADGLSVNFVDLRGTTGTAAYVDPVIDMQSANPLDPSASGQQHIADAFEGKIQFSPNPNASATMIDPRTFGAECNAVHADGRAPFAGMLMNTTSGSNVISISGYTFKNAPDPLGDLNKKISASGQRFDCGGTTTIVSVDTGANTATLANPMTCTFSGNGQTSITFGHDDTAAFHTSLVQSSVTGQPVYVPNGCLVENLAAVTGSNISGGSTADGYGFPPNNKPPTLYTLNNGFTSDPLYGIDITGVHAFGMSGFEIRGNTFPFGCPPANTIVSANCWPDQVGALIGTSVGTGNDFDAVELSHMSLTQGPVGFGNATNVVSMSGHIFGGSDHSSYTNNGIGWNMAQPSDFHSIDDNWQGNFQAQIILGPALGSFGPVSSRFTAGRIEDSSPYGLSCNGCGSIQFDNMQFQFTGTSVTLQNSSDITFSSGFMQGVISGDGGPAVQLSGSNRIKFDGVSFFNSQYALASTNTGATQSQDIEIKGGVLNSPSNSGGLVDVANWGSLVAPTHFIIDTSDHPLVRTGDTAFSVTTTGLVGIGTGVATPGVVLDMLSNTTTANSTLGLPGGPTSSRPPAPVAGMVRYNNVTSFIEGYGGAGWTNMFNILPGFINGLTVSNDATTPNTIIDIGVGAATSDDGLALIASQIAYQKTTGAWAVGWGNGCLDNGTIASSTWYGVFGILRTDTGLVDYLCSTSTTSPKMPANYTKRRLIGFFKTDSSAHILAFVEVNNVYYKSAGPTLDINDAALGATATMETLDVPTGIKVTPVCEASVANASPPVAVYLSSPDESDLAPTTTSPFTAAPGYTYLAATATGLPPNAACPNLVTNTSGQIRARASAGSTTLAVVDRGFSYCKSCLSTATGTLAIDSTALSSTATGTTGTVTLSTTSGNDVIILESLSNGPGGTHIDVASVSDTSSLTWTKRKEINPNNGQINLEEWYAESAAPISGDVITVTYSGLTPSSSKLYALAVSGANTTTPFDPNASLPGFNAAGCCSNPTVADTISTTKAKNMVINFYAPLFLFGGHYTRPVGFGTVFGGPTTQPEISFANFGSTLSSFTITYTNTTLGNQIMGLITDAIQASGQ